MAAFEIKDTICAVSTPRGAGGIAVVRISGDKALDISEKIWEGKTSLNKQKPRNMVKGKIVDESGNVIDDALCVVFRSPASFTGDDVVEFSVHGSVWIQREVLRLLIKHGARLAEPGEFTRRAFLNGKMNLIEAEAVGDLISSQSRAAARIALNQMRGGVSRKLSSLREQLVELASLLELELDFSEEDVEFASRERLVTICEDVIAEIQKLLASFRSGTAIKDGFPVAIVGVTNVGKSSLLNAFLGDERAIVSDIHGTTRDTIEEIMEIGDYLFRFIDTAGLRQTTDTIENLGIERSQKAISKASVILFVIDSTNPVEPALDSVPKDAKVIKVYNKIDLPSQLNVSDGIRISAKTGKGIDELKQCLEEIARERESQSEDATITNLRHVQALDEALKSTERLLTALSEGLSGDLAAQDLRETLHHIGAITGEVTSDEILHSIFSSFCIGK